MVKFEIRKAFGEYSLLHDYSLLDLVFLPLPLGLLVTFTEFSSFTCFLLFFIVLYFANCSHTIVSLKAISYSPTILTLTHQLRMPAFWTSENMVEWWTAEKVSPIFAVQTLEYNNVRKRSKREVGSWDARRIWSKNWSPWGERRKGPQHRRWHVVLSPRAPGNYVGEAAQACRPTTGDPRGLHAKMHWWNGAVDAADCSGWWGI